jgi:hypothetical protein
VHGPGAERCCCAAAVKKSNSYYYSIAEVGRLNAYHDHTSLMFRGSGITSAPHALIITLVSKT